MSISELAKVDQSALIVSDAVVEALVRELNDLHRSATLEFALKVGRLIVQRFYGGDLTAWRSHAAKEASFRKLAARADRDLHISVSSLYRAVALFELCARIDISARKHLGVAHLRAVLGLPAEQQQRLLRDAHDGAWTVRQVVAEAGKLRDKMDGRGRPPLLPFVKTVRRVSRLLDEPHVVLGGLEQASVLTRAEIVSLQRAVSAIRQQMDIVDQRLKQTVVAPQLPKKTVHVGA
jgi:hypothetical protein